METIFVNAIARAEAQSKQFGADAVKGVDAVKGASSRASKRTIGAVMFGDGDVIEIPKLPEENPETADCWLSKPLSAGGDPVLSVLVKCTSKSGAVTVKEFFIGSLFKSAENADTHAFEETKGTARNACEGLSLEIDQWKAIAGKKLKFSEPRQFQVWRRDFTNKRPDRLSTTTVWTIDLVD